MKEKLAALIKFSAIGQYLGTPAPLAIRRPERAGCADAHGSQRVEKLVVGCSRNGAKAPAPRSEFLTSQNQQKKSASAGAHTSAKAIKQGYKMRSSGVGHITLGCQAQLSSVGPPTLLSTHRAFLSLEVTTDKGTQQAGLEYAVGRVCAAIGLDQASRVVQ
jgi:hypothetical protein